MSLADAHSDLLMELVHFRAEREPFAKRWLGKLESGGVQLQVCALFSDDADLPELALRKALIGLPRVMPKHIVDGIRRLLEDAPDMRRNGFVIMPFAAAHDAAHQAIIETLTAHGLRALRADANAYASDLLAKSTL